MFCHRYPIQACVVRETVPSGALAGCEALETKPPRPQEWQWKREWKLLLPVPGG